jgi:peptidase E
MHDILAIGGNTHARGALAPLHSYALELTGKPNPRVCYIPTAGGDSIEGIAYFYSAFALVSRATHLPLFQNTVSDVGAFLREHDLIYVGGGNTRNMLALWRMWGVDTAIRAAWENGAVLAGPSAGGLCWFDSGVTDSYPGEFRALPCLGWTPGSFCPHYDSEPGRQPVVQRLLADGTLPAGFAVEDDAAVHVRDGKLVAALAQKAGKSAYAMSSENGAAQVTKLPMKELH